MLINYSGTRFLSTENYNIVTQFPGGFRRNTSDYKPPLPLTPSLYLCWGENALSWSFEA